MSQLGGDLLPISLYVPASLDSSSKFSWTSLTAYDVRCATRNFTGGDNYLLVEYTQ